MFSTRDSSSNPLRPVLTVSELTGQIKDVVESQFGSIYVAGEVSNAKVYPSGHWYFSLKDQGATLPCVCFKNANQSIRFRLEDGLMVIARGKLSVYPPRGAYQMVVTALEPVGIGDWQLAFEQLKEKLGAEGLLAPERKRAIPMLPRKVGVVTSPAGAALRDILNTIGRRNRYVNLIISPAKVQGEGSAESVAEALEMLKQIDDLDVIIVARGGGSIEDLWSFNTEVVARAVASSRVPVISGVGHETDITICDLVADLRAPTPTAAAELVASGHRELLEKWSFLKRQVVHLMDSRLAVARRQLERLSPASSLLRYRDRLGHLRVQVIHRREAMVKKMERVLADNRHRHSQAREKLAALGPQNVLARGFSIIRKSDGTLVRDFESVAPGELLEALLENGRLVVEVKERSPLWWPDGEAAGSFSEEKE